MFSAALLFATRDIMISNLLLLVHFSLSSVIFFFCTLHLLNKEVNSFDDNDFCLVSSQINKSVKDNKPIKSDVHPYPEFYFSKIYNISKTYLPTIYPQQNCNANGLYMLSGHRDYGFSDSSLESWITQLWERHGDQKAISKCVFNMCPLVQENIASAWKVIHWNFSADALCKLRDSEVKESQSKVQVLLFGGSMTVGNDAVKGCCVSSHSTCDTTFDHIHKPLKNDRWYCFWFGYLLRWFIQAFPNTHFEFHNLALAGHSSSIMSTEVSTLLSSRNIKLTKNDIVMLDHSCNDLGDGSGLELLVREIYRHCHGFDPTIIIIEQLPNPTAKYYKQYREIAVYYGLPYFSHREVILNPTKEQKYIFSGISSMPLHPPWHVHMLIADGLARWIYELIKYKCSPAITGTGSVPLYIKPSSHLIFKSPINIHNHTIKRYGIIKPLYGLFDQFGHFQCNKSIEMLIDGNPNSTFVPSNLTEFEKTIKGWTIYQDYEKKPPGWIINKYAPENNRTLNFKIPQLNSTQYTTNTTNSTSKHDPAIGLRVKYLKTYIDAGHMRVSLCGIKLREIDVLTHAHVSIPNLYHYKFTSDNVAKCNKLSAKERLLSFEYTGSSYPHNAANRKNFKVKILSVKMCVTETDDY